MKLRKLELVSLEDRSVPAILTTYAPASMPSPIDPTHVVVAPTVSMLSVAGHAATSQGFPNGRLSANHNQTLVRDRRRGKSRRG